MFSIGAVIAHIKADTSDFQSKLEAAKGGMASFAEGSKQSLTDVRNAALVVTGALTAIGVASVKLGEQAGKYAGVRLAFETNTKEMGIAVDDFVGKVAGATRGTLSNYEILVNANRAMALIGKESFGDFGEDFSKMAQYSRLAALSTGESVSYMFDSLVRGVGRASPLILDNLGIQVRAEFVNKAYAESIGKTAEELTFQEQKVALLNEAMRQLEEKYGKIEEPAQNFAIVLEQLKTRLANASVEIGSKLAPALIRLTDIIIPIIEEWLPKLVSFIEKVVNWFVNLSPPMQKIILAFIALAPIIAVVTGLILALAPVIAALVSPIGMAIVAVVSLATILITQWGEIKMQTAALWELITMKFTQGWEFLKGIGGKIVEAITKPFSDAWETVSGFINKIRDGLDFTKRHSPSILDIINTSVRKANDALGNLMGGVNINPSINQAGASSNITHITVNLAGAIIADDYSAERMAEKLGDGIINRLAHHVRI